MDTSTTYLGFTLRTPIVPSASPLTVHVDNVKRMEDAGAGAVVLHSLFEEQLVPRPVEEDYRLAALGHHAGSLEFRTEPDAYLELVRQASESVGIPVIGSLNATSLGAWQGYAKAIEQAGADALELNLFYMPTDIDMLPERVEQNCVDIVTVVKEATATPVAVKLGPYYSNLAHLAKRLCTSGADALVLFNRFYQPDIDLRTREVKPHILLSTPQAMRLPLRWISMLHRRVDVGLAASGGVHHGHDVIKLTMAGADVTMVCSALLRHGIDYISTIEEEMLDWLETYEYESLSEVHGTLSQRDCLDPAAFERDQYIRALQTFKVRD